MHEIAGEADQPNAILRIAWAKDACIWERLGELTQDALQHAHFVRVDLLSPKVVNEITRGGERHGAGRIWRPCFKLLCPLGERGIAQAHFANHVATRLNRVHRVKEVRARPESAAREERAHLVRAERVEVRTCIWNVHGHVRHRLTAIHGK